jgi:dolichol-phosphate mannosyltransferase
MNVKQKILIFVPTLNEKNNIHIWIEKTAKLYLFCDLLIVDDNSSDGTIEIIKTMQQKFSNLTLHVRSERMGIGSAHLWAFEYALKNRYDKLVTMDADLSHNPIEIQKLINESTRSNYVVGTRSAKKGGSNQSPIVRKLLTIGANKACSTLLFSSLSEYTTSFRCYDKKSLEIIIENPPTVNDYSFFIQISFLVIQNCLSISEVPIKFESRKFDKSKIPRSQIFLSIRTIINLSVSKIKK